MLRRIDWNQGREEAEADEAEGGAGKPPKQPNYCHLVWQVGADARTACPACGRFWRCAGCRLYCTPIQYFLTLPCPTLPPSLAYQTNMCLRVSRKLHLPACCLHLPA
jgi:hypothetical protein